MIALTASGLPPGATYTFSPATITPGQGATTVTLTVHIPAATAGAESPRSIYRSNNGGLASFAMALLLLPFRNRMRRKGKHLSRLIMMLLLFAAGVTAAMSLTGCGGTANSYFGQPQQSYTLTVTGTAGTLSHSTTITLTVE
jgi:hypothetical protein